MPRGAWSKKDERQYKAVLASCRKKKGRSVAACKGLAARVVNTQRVKEGRVRKGRRSSIAWKFRRAKDGSFVRRPFNPKAMKLRKATKRECFKAGRLKSGCVVGWGKYRGKVFRRKPR